MGDTRVLEFIVLGEIPGTSIQLTFSQIMQFVGVLVVVALVSWELKLHKIENRPKLLQDIINRLAL